MTHFPLIYINLPPAVNPNVADIESSIRGVYESLIRPGRGISRGHYRMATGRSGILGTAWSGDRQSKPVDFRSLLAVGVLCMDVVQCCCGKFAKGGL